MPSISWTPFVFLRYTLFLVLGILIEVYFQLGFTFWITIAVASVALYLGLFCLLSQHKLFLHGWIPGIVALTFLLSAGGLVTFLRTDTNNADHIGKLRDSIYWYKGVVDSEVLKRKKTYKAELEIKSVLTSGGWQKATGRIIIYQPFKDSLHQLKYGSAILIKGNPAEVPPPSNPGDFDFKTYAAYHNIYHQHFIKTYQLLESDQGNPIVSLSLKLREYCNKNFRANIKGDKEYGIVSALVLGVKTEVDEQIKTAYANAGVMHILAVSGMHVALIFQMLLISLGRLKKIRHGNIIFAIISLLLIWLFAFVTGLSASVLRAVVLFSFIVIGEVAARQKSAYNGLFLSAFVLLLYDPYFIMDVGFQLSYLAVIAIFYLYPKIYHWLDVRNKWLDDYWKIVAVSLAAQIVVTPLSIYYFHQFPTYFLIANIILIPITNIAMKVGIVLLVTAGIPTVASFAGVVLEFIIWLANYLVIQIQALPISIIPDLHLSGVETICLYLIICAVLILLKTRNLVYLKYTLVLCLLLSGSKSYGMIRANSHESIIIFKGSDKIEVAQDGKKVLITDTLQEEITIRKIKGIDLIEWNGKIVGIVKDSIAFSGLRVKNKVALEALIIQKNTVKELDSLSKVFKIKTVIIDDCNSRKTTERIKRNCRKLNLNYYSIYDNGAFQIIQEP